MADESRDRDRTVDSNSPKNVHDKTVSSAGTEVPARPQGSYPREIGGYRIIGLLGEGGMGVVYEAEQPSPRRLVALKVVRGVEVVDDVRLKMFQREAETLARLDHPNIGAIYESGRTEEGRHFFAMELVRGKTLADWLVSRPKRPDKAEIELRLHLFRQICDAVHYAHQRGVIHRDLKPSNLIVTDATASSSGTDINAAPMVKILDFGLARITEEDVAMTQITEIGVIKGTLPYMAPEQAAGQVDAIDVRTDVYALGVILYELLTGLRPYSTDTGSLLSAVKVICEQTPRPIAEVWNATVRLDPDLVTIAEKALDKEPDRRFASAAAFAEDIGRFLTSQPILARPASTMYQLKKLVSRRKALFAVAAASLVLLVVASIGIAALYVKSESNLSRALDAEQKALLEAKTAQRTSDFLVDLFRRANPENSRGQTITAREVMDQGARSVRQELEGEPIMQARLMSTIGEVYMSLGMFNNADSLIEEALDHRRRYLPEGDIAIAASEQQRARVLQLLGKPTEARAAYEKTIELYEAQGDAGKAGLIDALGNLGWMLGQIGEFDDATANIDRALSLADAEDSLDEGQLMGLLNNQATIKMNKGEAEAALPILEHSLEIARRIYKDSPSRIADIVTNLSNANSMCGKLEEASSSALEALTLYKGVYGDNHPLVAKALGNVGICYAQLGKLVEARPYLEQTLIALKNIYGREHPEIAMAHMNLGLLKLQSGDAQAAISDLKQAAAMHEKLTGAETPSLSYSLYHLASAQAGVGNYAESRRLMLRVVAIDEKLYGPESGEVADDLEGLAEVVRQLGQTAEADQYVARMNAIREKLPPVAPNS